MEDEFDIVYRQLFRKYYANLLFYATRMVGEEDAEDVVQEVFVELWHRKDSVTVGEQIFVQFSETASCISYFCHVCNLFSDCGSSTECCFVKCPFRDYDKADQGAVQVPIFL